MWWFPAVVMLGSTPALEASLILAQSPDPAEEKALEEDMEAAHRKIVGEPPPARVAPAPDEAMPLPPATQTEPSGEAHHQHGEYREAFERYEQRDCVARCRAEGRQKRREGPLIDGHGKGHYLAWSIVDWSVAGGMWVGSLASLVLGANAIYLGTRSSAEWHDLFNESPEPGVRRDLRGAGAVLAVAAVGLAVGGSLMSVKARRAVRTYRELKAQEAVFSPAR